MTEERTPPATAIERRQQLLEAIRRGGGTWDWQRARETYEPRPDPRTVRRDLQQLCKAGSLVRAESGGYEAA
ncbi:hypothetical protein GCM10010193_45280 [Kitasatospora atroaurantiaca]|uniref:DeoR family transcriptional regulator n=1 Tax=Kitasatospora atroaurantiaca TaxID=285545 RepID=A0A561EZQ5_9ACTN|nr:hypothetical protein [Kitasatospora atroaurantiaca]TWE21090.1 hypothetical protein FB465_6257 [Kitasatospora atroaurantiaca]